MAKGRQNIISRRAIDGGKCCISPDTRVVAAPCRCRNLEGGSGGLGVISLSVLFPCSAWIPRHCVRGCMSFQLRATVNIASRCIACYLPKNSSDYCCKRFSFHAACPTGPAVAAVAPGFACMKHREAVQTLKTRERVYVRWQPNPQRVVRAGACMCALVREVYLFICLLVRMAALP